MAFPAPANPGAAMRLVRLLLKSNRTGLLLTYGLLLAEAAIQVAIPYALGKAVDALVRREAWAILFITVPYLLWTVVGTLRRFYDTRFYSGIYQQLCSRIALTEKARGVETGKIVAHTTLSREFVDFLEQDIAEVFRAIVVFVGAILMLFRYSWMVGMTSLLTLVPILWANVQYQRRLERLYAEQNDNLEQQVTAIGAADNAPMLNLFARLRANQIAISDAGARNFALIEFAVTLGLTLAVALYSQSVIFTTGNLVALFNYQEEYINSLFVLPLLTERLSKLQDIARRLAEETPEVFDATKTT